MSDPTPAAEAHTVTYWSGRRDGRVEALPSPTTLAEWVAHKRARLGISLREAARQADVPTMTFHRAEHGGGLSAETYRRVVRWVLDGG
jgi:hypothetical protein